MSRKVVFKAPAYIDKLAAVIAQHRGTIDGVPYKDSLETAILLRDRAGNPVTVEFRGNAEKAIDEVTEVLAEYEQ